MQTVFELYKNTPKTDSADALGIVRTLFPDITVETFLEQRMKRKNNDKRIKTKKKS